MGTGLSKALELVLMPAIMALNVRKLSICTPCNSCNTGTSALPNIYAQRPRVHSA